MGHRRRVRLPLSSRARHDGLRRGRAFAVRRVSTVVPLRVRQLRNVRAVRQSGRLLRRRASRRSEAFDRERPDAAVPGPRARLRLDGPGRRGLSSSAGGSTSGSREAWACGFPPARPAPGRSRRAISTHRMPGPRSRIRASTPGCFWAGFAFAETAAAAAQPEAPPRIRASTAASMLPPETTQTSFAGRALGQTARRRRARRRRLPPRCARARRGGGWRPPFPRERRRGIPRGAKRPGPRARAARSARRCRRRSSACSRCSWAVRLRARPSKGAAVSTSQAQTFAVEAAAAQRRGDAAGEAASAPRHEHGVDIGQVLQDLQADRPVARDDGGVGRRVDEEPLHARDSACSTRICHHVAYGTFTMRAESRAIAASLVVRSVLRARRRCTGCPLRRASHATPCAMLPGARRPDAASELLGGGEAHRVPGAADLEGADRLEALELEEDLARARRASSRRSGVPESRSGDPRARGADLVEAGRSIGVVAASAELHELSESRARAPSSRCDAPPRRPRSRGPRT